MPFGGCKHKPNDRCTWSSSTCFRVQFYDVCSLRPKIVSLVCFTVFLCKYEKLSARRPDWSPASLMLLVKRGKLSHSWILLLIRFTEIMQILDSVMHELMKITRNFHNISLTTKQYMTQLRKQTTSSRAIDAAAACWCRNLFPLPSLFHFWGPTGCTSPGI